MAPAAVAASRPASLPRGAPSPPRRSIASSLRCAAPGARPRHNHVLRKPSAATLPVQSSHAVSRQRQVQPRCSQTEAVAAASSTVDEDGACELVRGADLVIGEGDDSVRAYLFEAVKNNNGTGILLLSDIFGFEDSATRDFAYRVACNGYNVLVPDLFRGNPWRKSLPSDEFEQWLSGHAPARVSGDVDACTRWLVDEFTVAGDSKKLGVIGFCYGGGRLVETLARDAGNAFSAGVCFYGSRMDASLGDRVAAPVLFVCGDGDALCTVETVRELERRARGAKAVVYAGRGHAFAHRPRSEEEDADAEDAFNAMRSWLHDHLLA
ncbi:hypothetical protein PR202_ga04755 [Eleusine coracana subsp. coracana]|uniref:Carboxymethylenebutenolidase homolog n=1 Tax=Eleusine coracana subsp. coracana TaxID=191504 RepID=A0AAV5BQP4_ELECO|nr:hypothetical protein QOZ80_5AG0372270 [Eleusine coracana subsp. coracana]GJM88665.1 hypothetical protein PR202_ga04755 [Eleusine coracana subsp. coracana]